MTTSEAALLARKTWRTVEPLHGIVYFAPEAAAAYAELGIVDRDGYFASRAAPMGAVSAEVVIATFFNFNPELVHHALPAAWGITTPGELVAARFTAMDAVFRRLLGAEIVGSEEMQRAAELARTAAEVAAQHVDGRPLAAAHAELEWPEAPHLVLWHAQSVLREYRGDGHIALLVTHGLSGIEALISHAASGDIPAHLLRGSRAWPREDWAAAVESMRARDWLTADDELTFTEWGSAQRQEIEEQTDVLAAAPYAALGEDGCTELRALCRPWSKVFSEVLFR
jgi:hypothetical protein